ncbi:acetate--CoA ligase family protein [Noviherbaspirillum sedimenti]|uniref:CoA-binding protein n=1 Tax=Noviherbaspirillum sedimenti TaxID=2320865 RepID=A0A3A3G9H3_9BURK|nr:acetate--CoA ligase family protein [Noviherbaspirillum sedimenti]RJG04434.1 CoA-binding protein [Noviherbaspirillum sedimenti]
MNQLTPEALRRALLEPGSLALVGASDDAAKTAGRPLHFLRSAGFKGTIYPINPNREIVQGERAWPSVASLPEAPDHAYILVPTEGVMAAVEECAARGVKVVTILASGFSEAGHEGAEREQRLRDISARSGMRILGPSSLGVVNLHQQLVLTANAAFAEPGLPKGKIFVASHSGSMIGALVSRGIARGVGFAGLVSVGNEADLGIGEICAATLDDPNIDGYMLFLETIRKGEDLRAFALGAAARGKPVIAYKLGRSSAAAELAVSHTGALAGEDDVADTFLRDCGIARVETLEALIEGLPLLRKTPLASAHGGRPRVGVVTTTGGGAAMVVDQLGVRNVDVQEPSPETFARLAAAGVKVSPGRIVDLTLAGTRYEVMKGALDVLLSAPEFDLVVAVAGSSARYHPNLAVRPVIDSASSAKPLAAFVVPEAQEALALLTAAGVANFRTPEACADAIASAFSRRVPKAAALHAGRVAGDGRMLDELEAYGVLDRLGVPHAPAIAIDANAAVLPDLPVSYPVVAKVLSAEIAHKTDVGGVVLGVRDAEGLMRAVAEIRDNVTRRRPGTVVEKVIAQPMVESIGEVLIGYRLDAQVGPVVMLAAGGVLTEIYRDRSLRLAPVDLATAKDMIAEVKALEALAGYRGKPAGDLDAVAQAIVALSQLACTEDLVVAEAEINPLLVRRAGQGVVAVDALVRLA